MFIYSFSCASRVQVSVACLVLCFLVSQISGCVSAVSISVIILCFSSRLGSHGLGCMFGVLCRFFVLVFRLQVSGCTFHMLALCYYFSLLFRFQASDYLSCSFLFLLLVCFSRLRVSGCISAFSISLICPSFSVHVGIQASGCMFNVFETVCFFAFGARGYRLRFSIALHFALFFFVCWGSRTQVAFLVFWSPFMFCAF